MSWSVVPWPSRLEDPSGLRDLDALWVADSRACDVVSVEQEGPLVTRARAVTAARDPPPARRRVCGTRVAPGALPRPRSPVYNRFLVQTPQDQAALHTSGPAALPNENEACGLHICLLCCRRRCCRRHRRLPLRFAAPLLPANGSGRPGGGGRQTGSGGCGGGVLSPPSGGGVSLFYLLARRGAAARGLLFQWCCARVTRGALAPVVFPCSARHLSQTHRRTQAPDVLGLTLPPATNRPDSGASSVAPRHAVCPWPPRAESGRSDNDCTCACDVKQPSTRTCDPFRDHHGAYSGARASVRVADVTEQWRGRRVPPLSHLAADGFHLRTEEHHALHRPRRVDASQTRAGRCVDGVLRACVLGRQGPTLFATCAFTAKERSQGSRRRVRLLRRPRSPWMVAQLHALHAPRRSGVTSTRPSTRARSPGPSPRASVVEERMRATRGAARHHRSSIACPAALGRVPALSVFSIPAVRPARRQERRGAQQMFSWLSSARQALPASERVDCQCAGWSRCPLPSCCFRTFWLALHLSSRRAAVPLGVEFRASQLRRPCKRSRPRRPRAGSSMAMQLGRSPPRRRARAAARSAWSCAPPCATCLTPTRRDAAALCRSVVIGPWRSRRACGSQRAHHPGRALRSSSS